MLSKKTLLTANNLNGAFISKSDTNAQTINSNLTVSGGALTLKNSVLTDNASATYLRIDPQGNQVIIYDGVNNQRLDVFSSSGSESTYITTINGTPSYGLIDVASAVDHLEINTNSNKYVKFGGVIQTSGNITSVNPSNSSANYFMGWLNNDPRIRIGGSGDGANGTFRIQGTGDSDRLTVDSLGNTKAFGTLTSVGKITASGGVGIYSSNSLSFDTYGGGFQMTDTTWIRTTGSKSFYHNTGSFRTDGTLQVGNLGGTLNVPANGQFNYMNGKFTIATGGAITTTGPITMTTTKSSGSGINMDGINIDTIGTGNLVVRNLNQIRFTDVSGWDYNVWAGIKYDSANLKMYIGGPASAQFSSNASPPTIDVAFSGVGKVGMGTDSPRTRLDIGNGSLSMDNGQSIWIGNNADSGDRLRLHHAGADAYMDFGSGNFRIRNSVSADVLRITQTGYVGIGTTSPTRLLDVEGSARVSGNIYNGASSLNFHADAGTAMPIKAGSLAITSSYTNNAPTNGLYVQGSAGIGTSSPARLLDVNGDFRVKDNIYSPSLISLYTDTGTAQGMKIGSLVVSSLYTTTAPANGLHVEGNVGIGNTNPTNKLDVSGVIGTTSSFQSTANNDVFQALGTGNTVKTFRWDNSNLRFWTNSLEVMTLTSGGNVGIAQATPTYKLDVTGDIRSTGIFRATGASNSAGVHIGNDSALWDINVANTLGVYGQTDTAVGAIKLGSTGPTLYGSGGSLGIGTTAPLSTMALDVNGNIRIASGKGIYSAYNNGYILNDHNNGNVTVNSAGGDLYLGFTNTSSNILSSPLKTSDKSSTIIGTDGTLYYRGEDLDTRYLNSTGDTILAGNLTFGGTNQGFGIYGNGTTWTRIDPNGQRFIMPVPIERKTSGDLILSIEDTTNWEQLFKLHANGDVVANNMTVKSTITTIGNSYYTGDASYNNKLTVGGLTTLNNNLTVSGTSTFTGDATFSGNIKLPLDKGIYSNGTNAIEFFGPASSGLGVKVGAGGLTIIGSGESADVFKDGWLAVSGSTAGPETLYLTSDNHVVFRSYMNGGYTSGNTMTMDNSGNLVMSGDLYVAREADGTEGAQGRIVFDSDPVQAIQLRYNSFDNTKSPFGLHLERGPGNTSASDLKPYLEVDGQLTVRGGKNVLQLADDAGGNVFMEFFARGGPTSTRSAWMGYGSSGSTVFQLNNALGLVLINSREPYTKGDQITWGTATPTGGSDGDVYIQY